MERVRPPRKTKNGEKMMKSTNKLYRTESGKKLLNTLNGNYWDARECISAMIGAIENAIPAADEAARTELRSKLAGLRTAYSALDPIPELVEDKII